MTAAGGAANYLRWHRGPTHGPLGVVGLGFGKFARADRIYALVPLEGAERQDGRRTYVHVDGLDQPIVASRSERAILADVETALAEAAGLPRRRRSGAPGQESLL